MMVCSGWSLLPIYNHNDDFIPTGRVNGRNLLFVQITSFFFTWLLLIFSKTFSISNTEASTVSSPPRNSSGRPGEVPPEDEQLWSTSINDVILYH